MTSPNYAALKAAMATGGQYAGMTDAEVLSAVNDATVTQAVDIPISAVIQALALSGLLPTVKGWASAPPAVAGTVTQEAAIAAATFGFIVGPPPLFDSLQMSVPATATAISGMVSALVSAGLLASTIADALLGLGAATVSQASLWGFSNGVYENDLIAARALS
jgi:hypothetical protein